MLAQVNHKTGNTVAMVAACMSHAQATGIVSLPCNGDVVLTVYNLQHFQEDDRVLNRKGRKARLSGKKHRNSEN